MGKILCATRGGADSEGTQREAIALAKAEGSELIFLYVADSAFLERIAMPVVVDIEAELEQMGRFQLLMAQEQAAEQGVQAAVAIRHGRLRKELAKAACELGATLIVMGRPQADGKAVFEEEDLRRYAADLERQTGIEVRLV